MATVSLKFGLKIFMKLENFQSDFENHDHFS